MSKSVTLISRSSIWVVVVQHKTSDQYLTSGKVSTRSIQRFKRYRLLKTLPKNFNSLSNAGADANVDVDAGADGDAYADADAVVTAIALSVLTYRRTKKESKYIGNELTSPDISWLSGVDPSFSPVVSTSVLTLSLLGSPFPSSSCNGIS